MRSINSFPFASKVRLSLSVFSRNLGSLDSSFQRIPLLNFTVVRQTVQSLLLRHRQTVRRGLQVRRSFYRFVKNVQYLFFSILSRSEHVVTSPKQERLLLASPPYIPVEEDAACVRRLTGFVGSLMLSPHDLELHGDASTRFCVCMCVYRFTRYFRCLFIHCKVRFE